MLTLICIILIICLILGIIITRIKEKKAYNNGYCPNCGEKLRHFDTDSQGGRGYTCKKCGYTTWVSYNIDK